MKHLYNTETVLKTETRVRIEANYNRTIFGMTKPGDILFYKAPDDPAEHPMYVDSQGRNIPVSPTTLQPMYNSSGNVVDKNGVLLPPGDVNGTLAHRDDIRIAVTSADFDVKDEKGDEILIAHDGEIIPTNDEGQPGVTMVNGVAWAIGKDGEPHAPLEQVYPLRSYVPPVRAENVPLGEKIEDPFPEYFDISHIVKADRPAKRGALLAWTSADLTDNPISTGIHGYDGARFYTAGRDMQYQYWTSPVTSEAESVLAGVTVDTFGDSWRVVGGTNKFSDVNTVSADFSGIGLGGEDAYFEKVIPLERGGSYQMTFNILSQAHAKVSVQLLEWSDTQPATPDYDSGSALPTKELVSRSVSAGYQTTITTSLTPSETSQSHAVRIIIRRSINFSNQKVTLSGLSIRESQYPILSVGPRAVYDRPLSTNKIVIGVDYSADDSVDPFGSYAHYPASHEVRAYVDRGDGWFEWQTVSTDPEIDNDGKITLYFDGASWGDSVNYEASTTVMGVQYIVHAMKLPDTRINVMEISPRRVYDVSDLMLDYNIDSEVADNSFVLPFGTVNSNTGSVSLSNHDGRFNSNNRFLLDRERMSPNGGEVFTDEPNPFYQMLHESVGVEIETATFVPGDTNRDWLRMITARSTNEIAPGISMTANIDFSDDSKLLQTLFPKQTFYSGETMSTIQVLYMLLDSVGFTNVRFADEDEHFAAHLKYFWVKSDDKSIWQIIEDVCRATQTIAFFDEFNVLTFKSLKGMYEDALSKAPAQFLTSEDVSGVNANILDTNPLDNKTVNRVTINYRETSEHERTPSGITPMEVVWEPDGTEVLRGEAVTSDLNDIPLGKPGASVWLTFPGGTTLTWPYAGMVQVEGEFIKYEGKQYGYFKADGKKAYKVINTEEERKELDEINPEMKEKNSFSGRLRISERGANDTVVKSHVQGKITDFTRRFRAGTGTTKNNYNTGLSIKNSRLWIRVPGSAPSGARTTVSKGHVDNYRPHHIGTRFRVNKGAHAGVCFLLNSPNDDGVYVELSTTESIEKAGRPRGELQVKVIKNGITKVYGVGIDIPVSMHKDYSLDVSIKDGSHLRIRKDYSAYYEVELKYGDKGAFVKVLQSALNLHRENLVVDGSFGTKTRDAVKRLQRRKNMTADGLVAEAEWRAVESGNFDTSLISVNATVDGVFSETVQIPKAELPSSPEAGRFGVFTRGRTDASFEYLYAVRGEEEIDYDEAGFYDYVQGGYVADQLDAAWIYTTKLRSKTLNGRKVTKRVINNQLYMTDFGPYAHEVREYDVVFEKDNPAMSSFLYSSNESHVHVLDYVHKPYGATFTVANKARHNAILNGEDTITFGSENAVNQKMMIYGTTLKIDDERSVTVSNETSINSKGVEEINIDVDWMQSRPTAEKLGSHIVEAMSNAAPSYSMDIFGHAGMRVGQVVSVYHPQQGIGSDNDPANSNRFFVSGVNHSNDGGHSTSLEVREVIGGRGPRWARLTEVLERNNNAMNMNPDIEDYVKVNGVYLPAGYSVRGGLNGRFTSPAIPTKNGGGAVVLNGTGATPYQSTMVAHPYPSASGRMSHNFGDYYLLAVDVTANTSVAAGVVIEGWPTDGSMIKTIASKNISLKGRQNTTLVLKGRFLADAEIPEIYLGVRALNPKNTAQGALEGQSLTVNSFYFRSDQIQDNIYPLHGGEALRKL